MILFTLFHFLNQPTVEAAISDRVKREAVAYCVPSTVVDTTVGNAQLAAVTVPPIMAVGIVQNVNPSTVPPIAADCIVGYTQPVVTAAILLVDMSDIQLLANVPATGP